MKKQKENKGIRKIIADFADSFYYRCTINPRSRNENPKDVDRRLKI